MRWSDLFAHLESDFAHVIGSEERGGQEVSRSESHLLDAARQAKASRETLGVRLGTGEVLHVAPRAVARDWFSGLVGGENGSGVIIPSGSVEWLDQRPSSHRGDLQPFLAASLTDVLSDLGRRRVLVTVRLDHGDCQGVVVEVGGDFVDVAPMTVSGPSSGRRIPFSRVVIVLVGQRSWG